MQFRYMKVWAQFQTAILLDQLENNYNISPQMLYFNNNIKVRLPLQEIN